MLSKVQSTTWPSVGQPSEYSQWPPVTVTEWGVVPAPLRLAQLSAAPLPHVGEMTGSVVPWRMIPGLCGDPAHEVRSCVPPECGPTARKWLFTHPVSFEK